MVPELKQIQKASIIEKLIEKRGEIEVPELPESKFGDILQGHLKRKVAEDHLPSRTSASDKDGSRAATAITTAGRYRWKRSPQQTPEQAQGIRVEESPKTPEMFDFDSLEQS